MNRPLSFARPYTPLRMHALRAPALVLASLLALTACAEDVGYATPQTGAPPTTTPDAGTPTFDAGGNDDANGTVRVVHVPSTNPRYSQLSVNAAEERWLDEIGADLESAFRLPEDLEILTQDCGAANAYYVPQSRQIVLCYELLGAAVDVFANVGGFATDTAFSYGLQTWFWVLYHEIGHALVDVLDLPVVGREEDAVDNFSTILFIDVGLSEVAETAAAFWLYSGQANATPQALADEHSLNDQRFYTILCLLYGSDPNRWVSLPTNFPEMEARLPRCQEEYDDQVRAWDTLLEPHLR